MKPPSRPPEDISFDEALRLILTHISPLPSEAVAINALLGRVLSDDVKALADVPSSDISIKDGFAVIASDVASALENSPIALRLAGTIVAGAGSGLSVSPGTAVKVMSGAVIPDGADAVVSREFTDGGGESVRVRISAGKRQNILPRGTDIRCGEIIARKGSRLRPAQVGILAASGHASAEAVRSPSISVIATGDEVLAVGRPMEKGKVFASNLVTLAAWCSYYGFSVTTDVVRDTEERITGAIETHIGQADALLTSGGAWKSERDLVVKILDRLGWKKVFHRVKMGPGKAIGFGILGGKPVFCLPGGPPSNQMAFLQLALPGLLTLAGYRDAELPARDVILGETVRGQVDWTQFIHGEIRGKGSSAVFHPLVMSSRLQAMAKAQGIIKIPEGCDSIDKGETVKAQVLTDY